MLCQAGADATVIYQAAAMLLYHKLSHSKHAVQFLLLFHIVWLAGVE
jgi:hypothetical protein